MEKNWEIKGDKMDQSEEMLQKTKERQEKIEAQLRKLSWGETEEEKDMFVKTIHQFFSPKMVPEGLSDGEARLIYIIASTFANARVNMGPLPMEWEVEKMTRDSFQKGLISFLNVDLSRSNGEIDSEGNVSIFSFSPPKTF
ncbi:MAG: hypothetical protein WC229_00365 [Candidatus Paceibacterota bacterium]